ncbi:MAG: 50S ribosomal protein L9 [Candidatus Cloacimonetes bacterium]|nr:50S ribosomal protein L9 [Candidatus Cloacimonadota bacterium]
MKIILTKDIKKVGEAGAVLNVADGYARNYLLPQKLAILANKNNLSKVEQIKKEAELAKLEIENKFKALALKMTDVELSFTRKADENGHLFGSVSDNDIVKALAEKDIEIHRSHVVLEKHLKEIGAHEVTIAFTSEITTTLKVKIENE